MLTYVDLRKDTASNGECARLLNAVRGKRNLRVAPIGPIRRRFTGTADSRSLHTPSPSRARPRLLEHRRRTCVLLMAAFNDEELTTFCYDTFRPVYEEFATGMSRTQKVQRLVEYCDRRGEMEKLLARVERVNPYQYNRFKEHLQTTPSCQRSKPTRGAARTLRWDAAQKPPGYEAKAPLARPDCV